MTDATTAQAIDVAKDCLRRSRREHLHQDDLAALIVDELSKAKLLSGQAEAVRPGVSGINLEPGQPKAGKSWLPTPMSHEEWQRLHKHPVTGGRRPGLGRWWKKAEE